MYAIELQTKYYKLYLPWQLQKAVLSELFDTYKLGLVPGMTAHSYNFSYSEGDGRIRSSRLIWAI